MRFKAIIFDIDGTLVDSFAAYQIAFNKGIARFGLTAVDIEPLADLLGRGMTLEQILLCFYPEQCDESFVAACSDAIISSFGDLTDEKTRLFPPVFDVLEALKSAGSKLGIATGRATPAGEVKIWLDKIGIGRYFAAIVTSDDVVERKPAPDCVIECARRLNVLVADCLVVGDSVDDVRAAKAAGAGVVAVLTGFAQRDKLASMEPLGILDDLSELVEFLESSGEARGQIPSPSGREDVTLGPGA